jgi:hypothetical protein
MLMSDISTFESRTAIVNCTSEVLYKFLTDIRNFEWFIPKEKFSDIRIEKDSCSFNVSMMGKVDVRIHEKQEFSRVSFIGNALHVNEFSLDVKFNDAAGGKSETRLMVQAHLNPFLKMLAAEPINRFMEELISEMEKFNGWKEINADN